MIRCAVNLRRLECQPRRAQSADRCLSLRYRFQISNTDHIIDVNKGNNLFEYDQVTIICPSYSDGTKEEDTEKYIIYNVSVPPSARCTD